MRTWLRPRQRAGAAASTPASSSSNQRIESAFEQVRATSRVNSAHADERRTTQGAASASTRVPTSTRSAACSTARERRQPCEPARRPASCINQSRGKRHVASSVASSPRLCLQRAMARVGGRVRQPAVGGVNHLAQVAPAGEQHRAAVAHRDFAVGFRSGGAPRVNDPTRVVTGGATAPLDQSVPAQAATAALENLP